MNTKDTNYFQAIVFSYSWPDLKLLWNDTHNPISVSFNTKRSNEQLKKALLERFIRSILSKRVFKETMDVQIALMAAAIEASLATQAERPEQAYLIALLRYQTEACRVALSDYHATPRDLLNKSKLLKPGYTTTEFDEMTKLEDWRRLAHLRQRLEQQRNAALRFRDNIPFHKSNFKTTEQAFLEFDRAISETNCILNHVHERIGVEVSQASLSESKAGIRMAEKSIEESRHTKSRKY